MMLLVTRAKASSSFFTCDGGIVSGMYRVGPEVVAMIHLPDVSFRGLSAFYVFRGQHGTPVVDHDAGSLVELVREGEVLDGIPIG